MNKRTQGERVLRALQRRPKSGVTRADFLAPNVIDGKEPIVNVPGRIYDLRQAGVGIEKAGTRNGCDVYRLPVKEPTLFDTRGIAA